MSQNNFKSFTKVAKEKKERVGGGGVGNREKRDKKRNQLFTASVE